MPHLSLTSEELDKRFPSLVAPDEELLNDDDHYAQDLVLQHGFTLAEKIAEGMVATGRTRHDPLSNVEDRVDSAAGTDPCGPDVPSWANGSRAQTPPLRTPAGRTQAGLADDARTPPLGTPGRVELPRQDPCWAGIQMPKTRKMCEKQTFGHQRWISAAPFGLDVWAPTRSVGRISWQTPSYAVRS